MDLLVPPGIPGKRVRRHLVMLFLLAFTLASAAPAQIRKTGGILHALKGSTSASNTTATTQTGCMSLAQVNRQLEEGTLSPAKQVELCQGDGSKNTLQSVVQASAKAGEKLTVEPSLTPNTAESGTGGFSGFLTTPSYPTMGSLVNYVYTMDTITADFLHHGYQDVLTIDTKAQLHLLANNGDGTFATPITSDGSVSGSYSTGYITAIAYDYDRDGYPDVLARDNSNYRIAFFHNNHDGTFTKAKSIQLPSCYSAAAMLLGDVTGDGTDDLIVFVTSYSYSTYNTTMRILVYPGDGTGDFSSTPTETDYTFEGANVIIPNRGALLGTNAGHASLYVEAISLGSYGLYGATVFALPITGDGTFGADPYTQQDFVTATIYANTNNGGLSLADLNNDGTPDLTVNFNDGYIYTALGASDGSFPSVVSAEPNFLVYPQSWEIKDIDGDGFVDFVVKNSTTIEVLPGLGTGKFGKATHYYTVANSNSGASSNSPGFNMAVADFNNDGVDDIAYVDASTNGYNRLSVLMGHGGASYQGPEALPAFNQLGIDPGYLYGEAMFDTNRDGRADLVLLDTANLMIRTARSDNSGNLTLYPALAASQGTHMVATTLATYDFNSDGRMDLVLDAYTTPSAYTYVHTLAVALNKGDGTFATPVFLDMNGLTLYDNLTFVAVGDINGDGIPDIMATTRGGSSSTAFILTFLGNADGTFQPATKQNYGTYYYAAGIKLADFNGDGKLDLFISDDGVNGSVLPHSAIVFGDGSGVFDTSKAVTLTSGIHLNKVLIGDLNGDGKPDLTLLSSGVVSGYSITTEQRGVLIYLNNGDGTFTAGNTYENGNLGGTGLLADVNGDGKLDLVFGVDYPWDRTTVEHAGMQLLLGNGDGSFGTPENLSVPPSVSFMASGDMENDGALDLMTFSYYVGSVAVLRNISGVQVGLTADSTSITSGGTVTFTASVAPSVSYRSMPTGTVNFLLNGTSIGTATLQGGSASLAVSNLPVGSNSITAVYEGDNSFSANLGGATVAVKVAAAATADPDFSLDVPSTSLEITSRDSGTLGFALNANSSFNGTVTLAISNAPSLLKVSLPSSTVTLTPGQTANVSVLVGTLLAQSAANRQLAPWALGMPAFGTLLCLPLLRRRSLRRVFTVLGMTAALVAAAALSGCGGNSGTRTTPSGTYTFVVTATPSVSGVAAKAFTVTVHVD